MEGRKRGSENVPSAAIKRHSFPLSSMVPIRASHCTRLLSELEEREIRWWLPILSLLRSLILFLVFGSSQFFPPRLSSPLPSPLFFLSFSTYIIFSGFSTDFAVSAHSGVQISLRSIKSRKKRRKKRGGKRGDGEDGEDGEDESEVRSRE